MMPGFINKRYAQPYGNKHIITDSTDTIREEDPPYIKNFPRFLHLLYRKQTPFSSDLLPHVKIQTERSRSRSFKSEKQGFRTITQNKDNNESRSPAPLSTVPSDFEHIFHYSETH